MRRGAYWLAAEAGGIGAEALLSGIVVVDGGVVVEGVVVDGVVVDGVVVDGTCGSGVVRRSQPAKAALSASREIDSRAALRPEVRVFRCMGASGWWGNRWGGIKRSQPPSAAGSRWSCRSPGDRAGRGDGTR
jgi:hypothetical protein